MTGRTDGLKRVETKQQKWPNPKEKTKRSHFFLIYLHSADDVQQNYKKKSMWVKCNPDIDKIKDILKDLYTKREAQIREVVKYPIKT